MQRLHARTAAALILTCSLLVSHAEAQSSDYRTGIITAWGNVIRDTFFMSSNNSRIPSDPALDESSERFSSVIMTSDGWLRNMAVHCAIPNQETITVVLRKNFADTLLRCSVSNASNATCLDDTNEVAVSAGDRITFNGFADNAAESKPCVASVEVYNADGSPHNQLLSWTSNPTDGGGWCNPTQYDSLGANCKAPYSDLPQGSWIMPAGGRIVRMTVRATQWVIGRQMRDGSFCIWNTTTNVKMGCATFSSTMEREKIGWFECIGPDCIMAPGDTISIHNQDPWVGSAPAQREAFLGFQIEYTDASQIDTSGDNGWSGSPLHRTHTNGCLGCVGVTLTFVPVSRPTIIRNLHVYAHPNHPSDFRVEVCAGPVGSFALQCQPSALMTCSIPFGEMRCQDDANELLLNTMDAYSIRYISSGSIAGVGHSVELADPPASTPTPTATPTITPTPTMTTTPEPTPTLAPTPIGACRAFGSYNAGPNRGWRRLPD